MFKRCLSVYPLWVYFTLIRSTPSITLPYLFTSHPPFVNIFQCTYIYPLPLRMLCSMVLRMFCHSLFLSLFPQVLYSSSTVTNLFFIGVCMWLCLFLCNVYCLDLSSTYGRKHATFVFLSLTSLNMMTSNCIQLLS
jgi:hypothetical protein